MNMRNGYNNLDLDFCRKIDSIQNFNIQTSHI